MGEGFTIQVSPDLVNRLAGEDVKAKRVRKPKSKTQGSRQSFDGRVHPKQPSIDSKAYGAVAGGWPHHSPIPVPLFPPSPPSRPADPEIAEIHGVLEKSERVMERLKQMEANMTEEVKKKAKELHDKEFKMPFQRPIPCISEKDACLQCYKENLKDPLKCSQTVEKFAECARKARQQV